MTQETVQLPPDPLDPGAPTEATGDVEEIGFPAEEQQEGVVEQETAAAPLPETLVDDGEEQNLAGNPTTQVPLRVAQLERRRRQALQAQLQETIANNRQRDEMLARLEERFRIAREAHVAERQAQEAQQQAQIQLPDPDLDPVGHWRMRTQMLEHAFGQQQQFLAAQSQQTQEQQVYQQQIMQVQGAVAQFAAARPDYYDALAFVRDKRDKDLQVLGVADPNERQRLIAIESENMIVKPALQRNQNPALVAYQLAQAWGYQPPGTGPGPTQRVSHTPPRTGNGAARMAGLERGAAASRTLSDVGTTTPAHEIPSLEALLSLDEESFDRFYAKNPDVVEAFLEGKS